METFKKWFVRLAVFQFCVTACTGLVLYFRPLEHRAGAYSAELKEWLVMLHNGEWVGELLFGNRYVSGLVIGGALAVQVARYARRTFAAGART